MKVVIFIFAHFSAISSTRVQRDTFTDAMLEPVIVDVSCCHNNWLFFFLFLFAGNGFIEGKELDNFLREFVSSVNATDVGPEIVSDSMLAELKECFMEAYDDNKDGKIEIRELAQLLPLEESFLLLFRFDNPLDSSVEFMKIWREYDSDNSGYIEADELKNFLRDLLKEAKKETVDEDKLVEYTDTLLQIFDSNKDGKLQLSEMAQLLPVKENFLNRSTFKGATRITKEDIERVFALYDRVSVHFILCVMCVLCVSWRKKHFNVTWRQITLFTCTHSHDDKRHLFFLCFFLLCLLLLSRSLSNCNIFPFLSLRLM